jgi:hypothetical protein
VGAARSLYNLGLIDAAVGDDASARRHLIEALELKESFTDAAGIAYCQWALAAIDIRENSLESARELLSRCLNAFVELGDDHGVAYCLTGIGSLALLDGDNPKAYSSFIEAMEIHHRLGDQLEVIATLECVALAAVAWNEKEHAIELLGAADRHRASIGVPRTSMEQSRMDSLQSDCVGALGPEKIAQALSRGYVMTVEQALASVRGLADSIPLT